MIAQSEGTTIIVAFLPDRVSYRVESAGKVVSSSGVMRASPPSLAGRGLKFRMRDVRVAAPATLQVAMLGASLDLQGELGGLDDLLTVDAQRVITRFLQRLFGSVLSARQDAELTLSVVSVMAGDGTD